MSNEIIEKLKEWVEENYKQYSSEVQFTKNEFIEYAVKKGLITAEEYELITGEPYAG